MPSLTPKREGMTMTIVEAARSVTGGVDTHLDVHVAAALDPLGALLGTERFDARTLEWRVKAHAEALPLVPVYGKYVLLESNQRANESHCWENEANRYLPSLDAQSHQCGHGGDADVGVTCLVIRLNRYCPYTQKCRYGDDPECHKHPVVRPSTDQPEQCTEQHNGEESGDRPRPMKLIPTRHVPEGLYGPLRHLNEHESQWIGKAVRLAETTDHSLIVRRGVKCSGVAVSDCILNEIPAAADERRKHSNAKKPGPLLPSWHHEGQHDQDQPNRQS